MEPNTMVTLALVEAFRENLKATPFNAEIRDAWALVEASLKAASAKATDDDKLYAKNCTQLARSPLDPVMMLMRELCNELPVDLGFYTNWHILGGRSFPLELHYTTAMAPHLHIIWQWKLGGNPTFDCLIWGHPDKFLLPTHAYDGAMTLRASSKPDVFLDDIDLSDPVEKAGLKSMMINSIMTMYDDTMTVKEGDY